MRSAAFGRRGAVFPMATQFETNFRSSAVPQLQDQLGEAIEYKSLWGAVESAADWQSLTTVGAIDRDPEVLGDGSERTRKPIVLVIALSDVPTIYLGEDQIRLEQDNNQVFRVAQWRRVAGGWELYCV